MSYTVSTSYIYTVPVCPTVQFLSLCRLHLQSFFQNIDTCIRIPVMNRMAFGTLPDTNAQIFHQRILISACTAGLAAWIECWYFDNYSSCPTGFIIKLSEELSPRNIGNTFSKVMITNHTLYIEVFYTDDLVFFHQCGRQLM